MIRPVNHSHVSLLFPILTMLFCLYGCGTGSDTQQASAPQTAHPAVIDAHAHIYLENYDPSIEKPFFDMLERRDMGWFDICTIGLNWKQLTEQVRVAGRLHTDRPGRIGWAVSFNLENWGDPDWTEQTIKYIDEGFANGAVAVKIWKEIGMELKDPDGSWVMCDDPRFDPVLDHIEKCGKVLVCHLGEPRNCWLPLDEMTVNGDRNYFSEHPQYHAYKHPEIPSYEQQIAARDHMLEKHPNLRVVGCHLGSLEYDVDEVAKRLDRFPNFAVDTAARIIHFKVQDRDKVRDFLIKYADRVLYGTDLAFRTSDDITGIIERFEEVYNSDMKYFSTAGELEIAERDEPIQCLDLPSDVVRKIMAQNAIDWYGGWDTTAEN